MRAPLLSALLLLTPTVAFADEPPEDDPRPQAEVEETEVDEDAITFLTGAFVGADWRVMRIGGHVSHGPGFQAGLVLWRHLKVGLAGFARPGPLNPATFRVPTASGAPYRGRSTLELRSDGQFFGLLLAPTFDIGDVIALEAPITLGQAAFGFYLTGGDRDTPDGRRVSEWENELLDGRDAAIAFGVEAGLRVSFIAASWARPYVGAHYFGTVGYDAYVRDDYDGVTFAAGIQLGAFR